MVSRRLSRYASLTPLHWDCLPADGAKLSWWAEQLGATRWTPPTCQIRGRALHPCLPHSVLIIMLHRPPAFLATEHIVVLAQYPRLLAQNKSTNPLLADQATYLLSVHYPASWQASLLGNPVDVLRISQPESFRLNIDPSQTRLQPYLLSRMFTQRAC